jgi:DNA-binding CsgD family transcriptional regulator
MALIGRIRAPERYQDRPRGFFYSRDPTEEAPMSRRQFTTARRGSMPDHLAPAAATVRGLLECDETYFLESRPEEPHLVAWRGSRQSRDAGVETLLDAAGGHPLLPDRGRGEAGPVRLSDVAGRTNSAAMHTSQQLFGRYQLALLLPSGNDGARRAWLLVRRDRDFGDDDVALASTVLPLLAAVDRLNGRPALVETPDPGGSADTAALWSRLSPREREVVDLLVAGLTAHRMGSILGISPRTVGKHLQNAYDKLGQHDRLVIALEHEKLTETGALEALGA